MGAGLPLHIAAALLGHLDLDTTCGYTAVFPDDVIRHHQQFIAGGRLAAVPWACVRWTVKPWGVHVHTDAVDKLEDEVEPRLASLGEQGRQLYGQAYRTMTTSGLKEERTMREKAFICLTADLCHPHLDLPLSMHVQMALANGVEPEAIRELYRHLAPYVGYPVLVTAFQRLSELGLPEASDDKPVEPAPLTGPLARAVRALEDVDPGLATFSEDQLAQRWTRPHLSVRERALACLVVDVFYQTGAVPAPARRAGQGGRGHRGDPARSAAGCGRIRHAAGLGRRAGAAPEAGRERVTVRYRGLDGGIRPPDGDAMFIEDQRP
ncbi:carboxymuconolactone decarboxylase family protein [Nonomuraea dietziae]|uniref:carboxymuconolactone decarboxylase family protein n=1 Tax=Nonomuraea dietziae TaxID=65515 RepID=UPI003F4D9C19